MIVYLNVLTNLFHDRQSAFINRLGLWGLGAHVLYGNQVANVLHLTYAMRQMLTAGTGPHVLSTFKFLYLCYLIEKPQFHRRGVVLYRFYGKYHASEILNGSPVTTM